MHSKFYTNKAPKVILAKIKKYEEWPTPESCWTIIIDIDSSLCSIKMFNGANFIYLLSWVASCLTIYHIT